MKSSELHRLILKKKKQKKKKNKNKKTDGDLSDKQVAT